MSRFDTLKEKIAYNKTEKKIDSLYTKGDKNVKCLQ